MVATAAIIPSGAALASASAKKAAAKSAAAKNRRAKSIHPRTPEMVDAAIFALKEKGGTSLQAIKKYMTAIYAIDAEKLSPFVKKYLKSSVAAKKLVRTKGKGASASFRLGASEAAATSLVKQRTVAKKSGLKKSPAKPKRKASPKKKVLKSVTAKPPKPKPAQKSKLATNKAKKPKQKKASAKK